MKRTDVAQRISKWIECNEKFRNLMLAPDGNLFVDPQLEEHVDWFLLYCNGSICVHPCGDLYHLGFIPDSCISFPVYLGETSIYAKTETHCILCSDDSVLDDDVSVFTVFQYGELVCMYTADITLSRRIHFTALAHTSRAKDWLIEGFFRQLDRHDPVLRRKLVAWLNGHGNSWKGGE